MTGPMKNNHDAKVTSGGIPGVFFEANNFMRLNNSESK